VTLFSSAKTATRAAGGIHSGVTPGKVVAIAKGHLKRNLGHAWIGPAQQCRRAVNAQLDQVRDRRISHRRMKAADEIPFGYMGNLGDAIEVSRLLKICPQAADGLAV
jgi:hypothetical protein